MTLPQDIQDMIDDFAFLTDWEDRYTHVIDMGKNLAPLDPAEKNMASKVKGCVSQVWLVSEHGEGDDPIITFRGDSDAHIVKGLVANEHLSPQRSNGLKAMIERIKLVANASLA